MQTPIRICVAGVTGWVGTELVRAIGAAPDLELAGAVSRRAAGQRIGGVTVRASLEEALEAPADVVIDYTRPDAVKGHVLLAVERGVAVVVGTSGLSAADYDEIDAAARSRGVGVVAAGNFSLTATLMQRFALLAAPHVGDVEIVDYAGPGKPDVPSGTARELAERLEAARMPGGDTTLPVDRLSGPVETRGAAIGGTRVHSVRLPSYVLSCEAIFGMPGERLVIRHDAGSSADPYVGGTLLAVRRVGGITGLVRGLDTLMFGPEGAAR
ncbi:4-hydroxy-tetrahydrodipicolinate reductase [Arenibaculum sp.]|uniref:4-hydroxy-tetrahydrodipicolinate reductase n=1 Tax=Arenibaculum sp. TaxID=2865862 RepID=UPI002E0D29A6|nr:4-hydroxy-tetrahydrodipicolinate reductase [Arenibaculum sp.]